MKGKRKWWKECIVYQIYPKSFNDSNGDGIGDIRGIIEKLDYLKKLGIDVIWLSPIYKSPNVDNGYDISDYYQIAPEYGTMEDMEELITELHKLNIKLIMDLVVNHTSNQHYWFKQSCSSKDNKYRDYYIWKEGKYDSPPNNWSTYFNKYSSAWEYDQKTAEYYLHLFFKEQPDLNWKNPLLREDIYKMMEWWLNKGIDGFRMDVINFLSKTNELPNASVEPGQKYSSGKTYYINGPHIHNYLHEMYNKVLSKYDIMTVGETPLITPKEAKKYVNEDRQEINMVFHFDLMNLDRQPENRWEKREWKVSEFTGIIDKWIHELSNNGWNSFYLSNHDQPRQVSRFGDDKKFRTESAKLLATLLLTLPGTPYLYQGEEIGMTNVKFSSFSQYRDNVTLEWFEKAKEQGLRDNNIMDSIYNFSRDNSRTPMQWSNNENAGFTKGIPWIEVNSNYRQINIENQLKDKDSVLNYYQKLINFRKKHIDTFVYGDYKHIPNDDNIYTFIRKSEKVSFLIILNFSKEIVPLNFSQSINIKKAKPLISNYPSNDEKDTILQPYECNIYLLSKQ